MFGPMPEMSPEMMSSFARLNAASLALSCGILALQLFLQFIHAFAYRGMMLRGQGVGGSIGHGWRVLRSNLGEIIPMALLFGGLQVAIVVAWYVAFFVLYVVFLVAAIGLQETPGLGMLLVGCAGLGVLLLMFVVAWVVVTTWRSAAFTIGYRRWAEAKNETGMDTG
jgi:hypothetical protein